MMRVVVVDLETSGLSPRRHEVLEVGWAVVGMDSDGVAGVAGPAVGRLVTDARLGGAAPEALAINRYVERIAGDGEKGTGASVAREIVGACGGMVLATWGADFDVPFLREFLSDHGVEWPRAWRRTVDLRTVAGQALGSPPPSLSVAVESLGVDGAPPGREHEAAVDAALAARVLVACVARGAGVGLFADSSPPAWVDCPCGCAGFVCVVHGGHVADCPCRDFAEWSYDPRKPGAWARATRA